MTTPSKKSYTNLRRHIIITLCIAAIIPVIFIGGGVYFEYRKSMTAKIKNQLTSIVMHHKESIERFLHEASAAMRLVVELKSFEEISQQNTLQLIFKTLQIEYNHAFEDIGIIDHKGNHVAYVGTHDLQTRNYSSSIWFKEAMEKQIYISDVFLGYRNIPHFIIAVRQGKGESFWILRATINAYTFGHLVENIRLGRTGEAFIINTDGIYQTRARFGGNVMETVDSNFLNIEHFDDLRLWETEKNEVKLIRAKAWLKNNTWLLIVQQEVDDAFSELFNTRNRAIILFIFGIILVGVVTFLTTELLIKRIEKADKEKELLDEQLIQSQKIASIGEFSAGIAHEINNPLAVINVEAELIQTLFKREDYKKESEFDDIDDSLREIKKQVNRCKEITHKLLNFARKMDSVILEVNMHNLIDEVVAMREREASFMNIAILKEYQAELPLIFSDPSLLRQVILNLINNAIDALAKGGELVIGTRIESVKNGSQKNNSQNDTVVIFIKDSGMGIPEDNLKKIFDPFFTTKPPGKGTGLGLSICHGIIQKLGGSIFAESEVGKGTIFTIKLPIEYK
ncbi:MAG: two-component sensor histidine kinase [Desulfamplus sp.]|nr:two-component sensor histidine kinase [Desulfamplus sp.]